MPYRTNMFNNDYCELTIAQLHESIRYWRKISTGRSSLDYNLFRTRSTLVALNSAGAREKRKKLSAITSFIGEAKKVCGLCK